MERLFSDEELAYLPIGFQFFMKPHNHSVITTEFQEQFKIVHIDYYNTNSYKVDSHYKPLSKIIKR